MTKREEHESPPRAPDKKGYRRQVKDNLTHLPTKYKKTPFATLVYLVVIVCTSAVFHMTAHDISGRGDGTNSFPIVLNTNVLENTTSFQRIAATLVYRSFELVNSKFK